MAKKHTHSNVSPTHRNNRYIPRLYDKNSSDLSSYNWTITEKMRGPQNLLVKLFERRGKTCMVFLNLCKYNP